jgi:hypothetical protein
LTQSLSAKFRDVFRGKAELSERRAATNFPVFDTIAPEDDLVEKDEPDMIVFTSRSPSGQSTVVKVVAAANLLTRLPYG